MEKRYLTAKDLEAETGTPYSTFQFWAWRDENKPPEERVGPPSHKLGRRRVWERAGFEAWLAKQKAKSEKSIAVPMRD